MAQLGAHRAGSAEVVGSRPTRSTIRQMVYSNRMGVHTPYVRGYRFESGPPNHCWGVAQMVERETRPHNLYTICRYPPVAQRQSACLKSRASQARNLPGGPDNAA